MRTPGLHHIILTITDVERSRAFYGDLLGFTIIPVPLEGGFLFTAGDVMLFFFPSRQPIDGDRFSEFRVGLDHLSFTATSKDELQELVDTLTAAGVATNGIEQFAPTGNLYVAFRDPDNIQLEYWLV